MVLENWTATCRRMKLDHSLTPYTKRDLKWMKDLNMRQESIKMLEENTGSNLFDLGRSNFLLGTSPKAREIKAKMNYWDFNNIKAFAQQGKQSTKPKDTLRNGRRCLHVSYQIKG